jgi:hemerythrin-like domain-containing protein
MKSAYESFPLGLQLSHAALTRNLDRFVQLAEADAQRPGRDFADFVELYVEFLDVHHEGEDEFVFPALRRHSAGKSTDAAHLERWTAEHRAIFAAGRSLSSAASQLRNGSSSSLGELRRISLELKEILRPHVASEEEVLTPTHLRGMISARDLEATQRAIAKKERPRALRMAGFLLHSLHPREQRELLGEAPWIFRKVLLGVVGERRMARFRPFVYERSVAL